MIEELDVNKFVDEIEIGENLDFDPFEEIDDEFDQFEEGIDAVLELVQ